VDAASIEARLRAEYEEKIALCTLAGRAEFIPEAVRMSVSDLRNHLLNAKAQESQRTAVRNQQQAMPSGAEAQMKTAAEQIAAAKNIPYAQAYVQAMSANPKLYEQYLAEKSATVQPN
jgi:hypothetical protein